MNNRRFQNTSLSNFTVPDADAVIASVVLEDSLLKWRIPQIGSLEKIQAAQRPFALHHFSVLLYIGVAKLPVLWRKHSGPSGVTVSGSDNPAGRPEFIMNCRLSIE